MANSFKIVKEIAQRIKEKNGKMYFVGGYVRDKILGIENKDIDVEIHNIDLDTLKSILSEFGSISEMGAAYGILRINGLDIDFSIPRIEYPGIITHNKIVIPHMYRDKDMKIIMSKFPNHQIVVYSEGPFTHTDFIVIHKYDISIKEASKRRDFTMNALYESVLTGEITDCWNGIDDLKKGIIRHVDSNTFIEDPLRVFRTCQFAARFNFKIAEETLSLCKLINLKEVSKERIFMELEKALMKAKNPSIFFNSLRKLNKIQYVFPELYSLIKCQQNKLHHPEGDVWNHTMMVIDEAAELKSQSSEPLWFMLSALCHDLGKPISTVSKNGKVTSYEHDKNGVEIARHFLNRITNNKKIIKYILNMVHYHMRPNQLVFKGTDKAIRRLISKSININDLILLSEADSSGRAKFVFYDKEREWFKNKINSLEKQVIEKLITGKDLIELGFPQGKELGDALQYAYKLQLNGLNRDEILEMIKTKKI